MTQPNPQPAPAPAPRPCWPYVSGTCPFCKTSHLKVVQRGEVECQDCNQILWEMN